MPSPAPEHLCKWIARQMADLTEEGAVNRFELYHTVDGNAERLEIFRMKDGSEAGDIAQALYDSAIHDASTRSSGHQRYTVGMFRLESEGAPETQFPFRINAAPANSWNGGDTENPTEKGERAQLMRQSNEMHNLMMRFAETFGGRMSTELDKERDTRHKLEQELSKRNADFEDLQDRRLDRELLRAEELRNQKFIGDIVSSVLPLLPFVVGGLAERFLMPGGKDAQSKEKNGHSAKALVPASGEAVSRDALMGELIGNLTQAEGNGMFQALKPMNRMVAGQIIQSIQNGDDSDLKRVARDSAIQKFLKGLETEEFFNILEALEPANKNRLLAIYKAYAKAESVVQEGMPDALKDTPPVPSAEPQSPS